MVELMAVIAVGVILLGIGIPSFYALIQRQRITTAVNDFFVAINLARSEAIRRGTRVDLVPAGDGRDWAKGWLVFVDENGNQRPEAGEEIIFMHGPVPSGISVQANFTDSTVQYLAYTGSGRTRTNASSQAPQSGTLTFLTDGQVRQIKLNFLGRARVCNPAVDKNTC